jgi:hypothetical protein
MSGDRKFQGMKSDQCNVPIVRKSTGNSHPCLKNFAGQAEALMKTRNVMTAAGCGIPADGSMLNVVFIICGQYYNSSGKFLRDSPFAKRWPQLAG